MRYFYWTFCSGAINSVLYPLVLFLNYVVWYWTAAAVNLRLAVDLETCIPRRDSRFTPSSNVITGFCSNKLTMFWSWRDVEARFGLVLFWSFTFFSRFHCSTQWRTNDFDFLIYFAVAVIDNFGPRGCKWKNTASKRFEKHSEFMFLLQNKHCE